MSELKNCPFCGREVMMKGYADSKGSFYYVACECGGNMMGAETKEEAAAKWNRRAEGWIPARKTPPELGICGTVLLYGRDESYAVGWYSEQAGGYVTWDDAFETDEPIAWRKLPEPWKGEDNG